MWTHRHLLGIAQLSRDDILHVLDAAERWFDMPRDEVKNARVLHGRTVVNLFYESSTRTRTSFEVAGKRLGADVVNVSPQTSSVTKGETLLDTVQEPRGACAPTPSSCATRRPARRTSSRRTRARSIVNAGDGAHEHPTQAPARRVHHPPRRRSGSRGSSSPSAATSCTRASRGRTRSLLGALGVEVRLCGPRTLMPRAPESLGPTVQRHAAHRGRGRRGGRGHDAAHPERAPRAGR